MADVSRRSLLRSFLLAPVAVRLAPFVRPAIFPRVEYVWLAEFPQLREWIGPSIIRRLSTPRGEFLPDPFLCSPAEHAFLTEGTPLPPEPTEFYEGNFFPGRSDKET